MAATAGSAMAPRTLGELLRQLGDIPAERVLLRPPPGHATEYDLLDLHRRTGRVFELVDGTLVEKAAGLRESVLAVAMSAALRGFVLHRNLGIITGASGVMRL